jgi:hypothetical protein
LPLPQPGPIEPAPTTIATLPLSRSIPCLPVVDHGSQPRMMVTLASIGAQYA